MKDTEALYLNTPIPIVNSIITSSWDSHGRNFWALEYLQPTTVGSAIVNGCDQTQ